jgi:hypothetical protein
MKASTTTTVSSFATIESLLRYAIFFAAMNAGQGDRVDGGESTREHFSSEIAHFRVNPNLDS